MRSLERAASPYRKPRVNKWARRNLLALHWGKLEEVLKEVWVRAPAEHLPVYDVRQLSPLFHHQLRSLSLLSQLPLLQHPQHPQLLLFLLPQVPSLSSPYPSPTPASTASSSSSSSSGN